jgi:hypothetical protein
MTPYHPQSKWRHQEWLVAVCFSLILGMAGLVLWAVLGGGQ